MEVGLNSQVPRGHKMNTLVTTLFDKIGGTAAVEAVVTEFYARVLADKELRTYFDGIDMDAQTRSQVSYIIMALDGPNQYDGRPMKETHAGMGITDAHFDRFADHLSDTLTWGGVEIGDVEAVESMFDQLRTQIVESPTSP